MLSCDKDIMRLSAGVSPCEAIKIKTF